METTTKRIAGGALLYRVGTIARRIAGPGARGAISGGESRKERRRRLLLFDQFPAPISMPLVAAPVVLLPVALRLGIIAVAAAGGGGRERRCPEQGRDLKQPAAAVPSSAAAESLLLLLLLLFFIWFRRHARSFSLRV